MKSFHKTLNFFGINLVHLYLNLKGLFWFIPDLSTFISQTKNLKSLSFNLQLLDKNKQAGDIYSHYFWQDLIVAKEVIKKCNGIHHDIGSRIDGFIGHLLSAGIKTFVFDLRPLETKIENLEFKSLDFSKSIPDNLKGKCQSLSCLHTIEHFGLGRYGDPIDINGHYKGIKQISSLIAQEGSFYLSFPIGKEKVYFNAHRVINPKSFYQKLLQEQFVFNQFILIDEVCKIQKFSFNDFLEYNFDDHHYSCGIFFLTKK